MMISSGDIQFEYTGENLVVITLEDITELVELRRILPICAHCRMVRDDADFWHQVEDYFQKHTRLQISHGICPECMRKQYPDLADSVAGPPSEGGP